MDTQKQNIKVSWFEMIPPYDRSQLKNSLFHGYFNLCYMLASCFLFVYPLLKFVRKGIFFQQEVRKLLQTNILWDLISVIIIIGISMLSILIPRNYLNKFVQFTMIFGIFITGWLIVNIHTMYHSDRAFIVLVSWGFAAKIFSYFNGFVKEENFGIKVKFLFSPLLTYTNYPDKILPNRKIHKGYIINKFISCLCCIVGNCILIAQIIDPVFEDSDNLSFFEMFFQLIPPMFYLIFCLYYFLAENIMLALAELAKLKDRKLCQDWWNAINFADFIIKLSTVIDDFHVFLIEILFKSSSHKQNLKIYLHVTFSQLIMMQIFKRHLSIKAIIINLILSGIIILSKKIKSPKGNFLVHVGLICFYPLMVTLEVRYKIFS